jgi:hypothetical protein
MQVFMYGGHAGVPPAVCGHQRGKVFEERETCTVLDIESGDLDRLLVYFI